MNDDPATGGPHRAPWTGRLILGAGGAAAGALAGIVVLALRLGGAAPACAAPPVGGTTYTGQATHYLLEAGGGNCSYPGPPDDDLYVALSPGEYDDAAACGGYLDVTGPRGTIRVKVVDQCPECATGHIDLSRGAFARIGELSQGIVPVTYQAVADPPSLGPLAFRIKDGASQWWFAVLVVDHGNPLTSVAARGPGSGWQQLVQHDYNYWIAENGLGPGPYEIRVTDVYGHEAAVAGIRMAPEQLQTTDVRLYGTGAPVAPPTLDPLVDRAAGPRTDPAPSARPSRAAATGEDGPPTSSSVAVGGMGISPSPSPCK